MLEIGKTTPKELLDEVNKHSSTLVDLDSTQTITGEKTFETIPKSPVAPTEKDHVVNFGTFSEAVGELLPNSDWAEIHLQLVGGGGRYGGGQYSDIYLLTQDVKTPSLDYATQYVAISYRQLTAGAQAGLRGVTYGGLAILVPWAKLQEMYPTLATTTQNWTQNGLTNQFHLDFVKIFSSRTPPEQEIKDWVTNWGLKDFILAIGGMSNCYDSGGWRFAHNLFLRNKNTTGAMGANSNTIFTIYFIKVGRLTEPIYDITYTPYVWTNSADYNKSSSINYLKIIQKGNKVKEIVKSNTALSNGFKMFHMAETNKLFEKPLIEEATINYVSPQDINQSINGRKTFKGTLLYTKDKAEKSSINEVVTFGDKMEQENYVNFTLETLKQQSDNNLELQGLRMVFTCTASSGSQYNTYCGLSNCQFLDSKGKVWYVVARKLVATAGANWNSIWISRTMPTDPSWNLGWSKVKAITDDTDPYLEQFADDLIEIKARQNATASNANTWGWGVKSFQVVCEYDTDQSKMGSLSAGNNASVTIEFLIEKSQIDKPCFKELVTLRGIRGGFSNGASNPASGAIPSSYYMSRTINIKVEYLYGEKGTGLVYTYLINDSVNKDKNIMFKLPVTLSEGASINSIDTTDMKFLDMASATGMTYKNIMSPSSENASLEPINISMVNINNNNLGYTFTQEEYNNLSSAEKMNNKLYIITSSGGGA